MQPCTGIGAKFRVLTNVTLGRTHGMFGATWMARHNSGTTE
ncbi:hypothetical protein [Dyella amyloliquefaciens]|nr:hypothetical protein [Dyella amyloliquefaciens]